MTLFPHDDSVARIIESWKGFAEVLTAEDRAEFDKMMGRCYRYATAIEVKAQPFENEALFMALIFEQEKIIRWLLAKVEGLRGKKH
jgi:hypothetical protein